MLDFNGIGIKSPDDLQEALQIETSSDQFIQQFMSMVDRWGLEGALFPLEPIVKFKKRMVPNGPENDPWEDYKLEDIK